MTATQIAHTWKSESHNVNTTLHNQMMSPAGLIELTDDELLGVDGGTTAPCVTIVTILITLITLKGCSK